MNEEVVKLLLSGLPSKIQCSNEKQGAYRLNIPKVIGVTKFKFIQFAHPQKYQWLSIDIDDRSRFQEFEHFYSFCDKNVIPVPTIIVKTSKGWHLHWYLDTPIWKNNRLLLSYRKKLIRKLNEYFGGDKHSAGYIFRNPLFHDYVFMDVHYTLNDFEHIVSLESMKKTIAKKRKSIKKTEKFIDFTAVKVGERNNTLFQYIRTFTFRNIHLSFEQVLKEAVRVNDLMIEPLNFSEVKATTASAYSFAQRNYNENYKKNKYQAQYNRLLAKYKAKKTYIKGFKNIVASLKEGKIAFFKIIWGLVSFRKLAKIAKISDKTIKKYLQKIKKDLIALIHNKKISFEQIEQIIKEEIALLQVELVDIEKVKEVGVLRC